MKKNTFVNPRLRYNTIDIFHSRKSIFDFIVGNKFFLKGKLLDAGCGNMPYKKYILQNSDVTEYVSMDLENNTIYKPEKKPDINWDGVTCPSDDEVYDVILATEVLEHCPNPEIFLNEMHRVLKRGGLIFFTTPFFWPTHDVPHDEFRYTPYALERFLKNSGFKNVKIQSSGGWHAAFAQMIGLWVRRSPITFFIRLPLSFLFLPILWLLFKIDSLNNNSTRDQMMLTTLCGFARK